MKIQQPILIGHSMGGGVSLYAAMKNKEIKGIIFENGAPFFKPPVFFKIAALPIFTPFITLFFRLANRYAKNLAEFFFRTAMINKEAISKDLTKRYIAPGTVKGTETVFRNSLKVKPSVFTTQDYQKIECKVLLLRGKKDTIIPLQQVGKLHSILPHSTMMLVPNVGHMLHEEVPEAFINIIKSFVTELS